MLSKIIPSDCWPSKTVWWSARLCQLVVAVTVVTLVLLSTVDHCAQGFIFWKATTTACDICDGIDTYSGRNVACCFLQSKCCGYQTLDEAEAIRANLSAANSSP